MTNINTIALLLNLSIKLYVILQVGAVILKRFAIKERQ